MEDLKSMSVHDLIRLQMKVGSALKRKKGALAKAKAATKKKVPKYAHPSGKTWSGFGPRPARVKEALKKGQDLQGLLVN